MDGPWYVLSTAEPGYKPIYFLAHGTTLEFHCHKSGNGRPFRYRKLENAITVRDRLNEKAVRESITDSLNSKVSITGTTQDGRQH